MLSETEFNTTINQTETNTTINNTNTTPINDTDINITNKTYSNFTIVTFGDSHGDFSGRSEWIRDNREALDIKMFIHTGDIGGTVNNTNNSFSILENNTPYVFSYGNNDYNEKYKDFFPMSRYENRSWFGGYFNEKNYYTFFNINNQTYIILSLEYQLKDSVWEWASEIINNNTDNKIIIASHSYMGGSMRTGEGEKIWNNLIDNSSNVFLMLCGHLYSNHIGYNQRGDGGYVFEIMSDYETDKSKIRIITFVEDRILVSTYSLEEEDYINNITIYPNTNNGLSLTGVNIPSSSVGGGGGSSGSSRRKPKPKPIPCNKTKWSCEMWQIYPEQWTRDCINECNQTRYEYKVIEPIFEEVIVEFEVIELDELTIPIYSEPINVGFFRRVMNYFKGWF